MVVCTRPWPTVRPDQGRRGQQPRSGPGASRASPTPLSRPDRPAASACSPTPRHHPVHQPDLDRHDGGSHRGEHRGRRGDPEAQTACPEEGEGGLESAEGDQGAESHRQQGRHPGATGQGARRPGRRWGRGRPTAGAPARWVSGQPAGGHDGIDGGDGRGQEEGQPRPAEGGQRAQGRAGDEPDPERRPEQPEQPMPVGAARPGRPRPPGPPTRWRPTPRR